MLNSNKGGKIDKLKKCYPIHTKGVKINLANDMAFGLMCCAIYIANLQWINEIIKTNKFSTLS
jgi:hypothetical protein